jgi:hypothetical protein
MSRRFRMLLFLCLAAATGLHLRPCLGTLRRGIEPGVPDPVEAASPDSLVVADRQQRPSLGELSEGPTLVGLQAAVVEAR